MPRRLWLLTCLVALSACAAHPVVPTVVKVPVVRYVPVPAGLTTPCEIVEPTDRTVGEAVRVARARRASLEQCNNQLDGIRSIQVGNGQ
jgi:hypothetical protein